MSTANTFHIRPHQKRQRWFVSTSLRLHKHLEKTTAEVNFDELTKDQILDRQNFSLDNDGAIVKSAGGGRDNRGCDRGISVKYTNQLIMKTYKIVDFCKHSISAKHSCVWKDCQPKENLNVSETPSIRQKSVLILNTLACIKCQY